MGEIHLAVVDEVANKVPILRLHMIRIPVSQVIDCVHRYLPAQGGHLQLVQFVQEVLVQFDMFRVF
jgi:hypothetical protein